MNSINALNYDYQQQYFNPYSNTEVQSNKVNPVPEIVKQTNSNARRDTEKFDINTQMDKSKRKVESDQKFIDTNNREMVDEKNYIDKELDFMDSNSKKLMSIGYNVGYVPQQSSSVDTYV